MNSDPKIERRYGILLALRSSDWVSARALADRFDVSVRTIYRDVEDLLSYGIPIAGVRGPEGGYRLRPESPLDPMLFSSVDAFALYLERDRGAAVLAGQDRSGPPDMPETLRDRVFFDTRDWYWRGDTSRWFDELKDAITERRAVQLTYRERGTTDSREVLALPYGLVWRAGEWYLVGPELRGPIRRFSLARIGELTITSLTFPMPSDFSISAAWAELTENFGRGDEAVVIKASREVKPELLRLYLKSDSKVEEREDGSVEITLFVDSWRWLIPLIASFGPGVRVLKPLHLRDSVVRFFREALSLYDDQLDGSVEPATFARQPNEDPPHVQVTRGRRLPEDEANS